MMIPAFTGVMPSAMHGEGAAPLEFPVHKPSSGGRNTLVLSVIGPGKTSATWWASRNLQTNLVHGKIRKRLDDA